MTDIPASLARYLEAWNELDPTKIRAHLEHSCAEDILFIDPAHTTRNMDDLEAMIIDGRRDRPKASYHRISGVDGHNLRYRYLWEVRIDGEAMMPGMDVTTVNEQGLIVQIDGFFGDFPKMET